MIAIVDYGVGNLHSLRSALKHLQLPCVVTREENVLEEADQILLPGVGAFGDAAQKLHDTGLFEPLRRLARSGRPLLGICLGMQLLFEKSFEYGEHAGLGLIAGSVRPLRGAIPDDMKVPHMGWNSLDAQRPDDPLLRYARPGEYVYFVHSYYACECEQSLVATARYGVDVPAIVRSGNVCGTQFHPEKSGRAGLEMLRAFSQEKEGMPT